MSTATTTRSKLPRVATVPTKSSQYRQQAALESRQRRERVEAKISAQLKALNVAPVTEKRPATTPTARLITQPPTTIVDEEEQSPEQTEKSYQLANLQTRVITLTSNKVHLEQKVQTLQRQVAELLEEKKLTAKHASLLEAQVSRLETAAKARHHATVKHPVVEEIQRSAPPETRPGATAKYALEEENTRLRAQLAELANLVQEQKKEVSRVTKLEVSYPL